MCFDFVKPFCTQDSYVISSGEEIVFASFPLFSDKTVLDNLASAIKCEAEEEGNETRRRNHLSWLRKQQYVCMSCKFSCIDHMGW